MDTCGGLNGWHSTPGQKYSGEEQLASFPAVADLPQDSVSFKAMQREQPSRAICWKMASTEQQPCQLLSYSLAVFAWLASQSCMRILLREPYFPLFNTIFHDSLCNWIEELKVFGAGIIFSLKFRTYSDWVSVPQFLLLVSHCHSAIN